MAGKLRFTAISFLVATAFAQNPSPVVNGNKNQSATTNNGAMIQNNITVTDPVKKALQQRAKDIGDEQGWLRLLTPANDPTPQSSCNIPDNSLAVFLGDFVGTCSGNSCTILQDNSANADIKKLLSVERKGSSLLVEGVVFGEDGKVVVSVESDRPHVNKQNVFGWKRPDDHTLEVTDQKDRTVLHIRFMNKTTLYVEGLFYTPSGMGLKISKDTLQIRTKQGVGPSFHGGCARSVPANGSVFVLAGSEEPNSGGAGQQAPAYEQKCVGSACAQGPGAQATFNQYGAPRFPEITPAQHVAIRDALTPYSGSPVVIACQTSEDVTPYAHQLYLALHDAGMMVSDPMCYLMLGEVYPIPSGISFKISSNRRAEAIALSKAMGTSGMLTHRVEVHTDDPKTDTFVVYITPNR